jgi:hypothetical protein
VLRLDVRDEHPPGSVALDRRELHTSIFGHAGGWGGGVPMTPKDPQTRHPRSHYSAPNR